MATGSRSGPTGAPEPENTWSRCPGTREYVVPPEQEPVAPAIDPAHGPVRSDSAHGFVSLLLVGFCFVGVLLSDITVFVHLLTVQLGTYLNRTIA